jgi:hypothetical protein
MASRDDAIALPSVVLPCQDAVAIVRGGGISMSTLEPDQSRQPALTGKQLALIVYILYLVAYFTGITAVIGASSRMCRSALPILCWRRITAFKSARSGSAYCIS